jgi:glycosyltransferase involved in cell wall biosynthesis
MNTVDVVIPCYNYARFLNRCVASVLSQEAVDVRVLIIDDTSSDDTPLVGQALAASDPRVEFRRHTKNKGHIATYNEGLLEWARSDYSVLLSADDALTPGCLARAVSLMDDQPRLGMTYGLALIIDDESGHGDVSDHLSSEYRIVRGADFIQHCCEVGNPVPAPCAVVRTDLQKQIGGYRSDLPHSGDMEMWMRFAVHGDVGVFRAVQGFYRRHEGNMSNQYYTALLSDQKERLRACSELIQRWGADFPESTQWRESSAHRLALEALWLANRAFDAGDVQTSTACLAFAEETYPELRRSRDWKRFAMKRRLGLVLWHRLYPFVDVARRLRGRPSMPRQKSETFEPGDLTGWWPEVAC